MHCDCLMDRYDQPLYNALHETCGNFSNDAVQNAACKQNLDKMNDKIGDFGEIAPAVLACF